MAEPSCFPWERRKNNVVWSFLRMDVWSSYNRPGTVKKAINPAGLSRFRPVRAS